MVYDALCCGYYHIIVGYMIILQRIYPDGNEKLVGNKCRNPNNDPGGPWCVVGTNEVGNNDSDTSNYEITYNKQYCHVHFCDSPGGLMMVTGANSHKNFSQFTYLPPVNASGSNNMKGSLEFYVKLWYSEQWRNAEIRIALSRFPIPVSSSQLRKWSIGFEVVINNDGAGIIPGENEEKSWELHPGLLVKSIKWLNFLLVWDNKQAYVYSEDITNPLFIHEFNVIDKMDFSRQRMYYSIVASPFVWYFPLSITDDFCELFVTTGFDYSRIMPMKETEEGREIIFWMRAARFGVIKIMSAPVVNYPSAEVLFMIDKSVFEVRMVSSKDSDPVILHREKIDYHSLPSYWKWNNYNLIIEGDTLRINNCSDEASYSLVSLKRHEFLSFKWFAVGTENTVAHWTFFCSPEAQYPIPEAVPPECVGFSNENYLGTDWITKDGLPCIPWTGLPDFLVPNQNLRKADAFNYCRQLSNEDKQTYCYAVNISSDYKINEEICEPRKCFFESCQKSGIGIDYVGRLQMTLTNKTCQLWSSDIPNKVPEDYKKDAAFPELSVINASNYCRNPSKDSAGLWCFTLDNRMPVDLCDISDCDKPYQFTVIVKNSFEFEQKFIVTPRQRIFGINFWIKNWDPSNIKGTEVVITMRSRFSSKYFQLSVGGEENNQLKLSCIEPAEGKTIVIKEKHVPLIISSAHWKGFKLLFTEYSVSIMCLSLSGTADKPLFEWVQHSTSSDHSGILDDWTFDYISIMPSNGHRIGLHFNCSGICQTEVANKNKMVTFYPISLWTQAFRSNQMTVYLTTNGTEVNANIFLFTLLETDLKTDDMVLKIHIKQSSLNNDSYIELVKNNKIGNRTKISSDFIKHLQWTIILISWTEYKFQMSLNGSVVIECNVSNNTVDTTESTFLFYYFSVNVADGEIIWSANFIPLDIKKANGRNVDGGWSDWGNWHCSTSCGGGIGIRRRTCTNPPPTLFGRFCNGSDTNRGICNKFPCGSISKATISLIEEGLKNSSYNIDVMVRHSFIVDCSSRILTRIKRESPESTLMWQKDGRLIKLKRKLENIDPKKEYIEIEKASYLDTGLYICFVESPNKERTKNVLKLTAVVVKNNKYTKYARTTNYFTLNCDGSVLSYIYSNLDLMLKHNGRIWRNYYGSPLSAVSVTNIGPLNESNSGIWECIIQQRDLKLLWKTQWIFLNVRRAPTFLTNLAQDSPLRVLFNLVNSDIIIFIIFLSILILIVIATVLITLFVIRRRSRKRRASK